MKIYASQSNLDLAQFVGSDLWLRVVYNPNASDRYVKITNIYSETYDNMPYTFIDYYDINARLIEIPYKERITNTDLDCLWYFKHYRQTCHSTNLEVFLQDYTIKTPLDILSDEEVNTIIDEAIRMYL